MVLATPARWVLTCLISVGLQLCCCNFKVLFGECCEGEHSATHIQCTDADGDDDGALYIDGSAGDDHHHEAASASHDDHGQPTQPCDHHDNGGCSCGTHDKAPNLIGKTCLDIAPVVIAILPQTAFRSPALIIGTPRYAALHAVLLPQTSLLEQHCALIV